jgi:hypothetical protein
VEEHLNDLRSARADFAAVLKLPTTNSLSVWAHAMARERLAATEAAAKSAATSNPAAAALNRVAAASDFWRRPQIRMCRIPASGSSWKICLLPVG